MRGEQRALPLIDWDADAALADLSDDDVDGDGATGGGRRRKGKPASRPKRKPMALQQAKEQASVSRVPERARSVTQLYSSSSSWHTKHSRAIR